MKEDRGAEVGGEAGEEKKQQWKEEKKMMKRIDEEDVCLLERGGMEWSAP